MPEIAPGVVHFPGYLDVDAQARLASRIMAVIGAAPLYTSTMPISGKPMSVRMTNCGPLGWMSDREKGYRYEPHHPVTGEAWPPIPQMLLDAWGALTGYRDPPEACLLNVYSADAKMGLHQDRDEKNFDAPILSLSLGADCRFKIGGTKRSDKTTSFVLSSGDALTLSGPARLCFHGIDRILPTLGAALAPPLGALGARINLTLRRVN